MRYHCFKEAEQYSIALLMKSSSFNKQEIRTNYVNPLVQRGIAEEAMIAFTLKYDTAGKAPVKFIKEYLDTLLPTLQELGVKHLLVADSAYFKTLTGQTKAESSFGYILPCKIKGYEEMDVVLSINYQALIYNPDLQAKLNTSLSTIASSVLGNYEAPGTGIIHSAQYPESLQDIAAALESLHQYESLSCDIETRSLRFCDAGIETIAFAWDKHTGIAFCVEKGNTVDTSLSIKCLLKEFFTAYKGKLIYHNATYDLSIIIYELWMKPL